MTKKTYRPHKNAEEGFEFTYNAAGETTVIDSWPHESEDSAEQQLLESHPQITDRPEPKKKEESGG